jgi:hypothetical protein
LFRAREKFLAAQSPLVALLSQLELAGALVDQGEGLVDLGIAIVDFHGDGQIALGVLVVTAADVLARQGKALLQSLLR